MSGTVTFLFTDIEGSAALGRGGAHVTHARAATRWFALDHR